MPFKLKLNKKPFQISTFLFILDWQKCTKRAKIIKTYNLKLKFKVQIHFICKSFLSLTEFSIYFRQSKRKQRREFFNILNSNITPFCSQSTIRFGDSRNYDRSIILCQTNEMRRLKRKENFHRLRMSYLVFFAWKSQKLKLITQMSSTIKMIIIRGKTFATKLKGVYT